MKRIITILAAGLALLFAPTAGAEEVHPAVQAADNANVAFVSCVEKMTAAASSISTESTRVMMIEGAPDKCARYIARPAVQSEPSASSRAWAFGQFLVGAIAQYKGQALIWGAVTSLVNRGYDATENTASQGLTTAENLGMTGMDYASKPPLVIRTTPAPAEPTPPAVAPVATP